MVSNFNVIMQYFTIFFTIKFPENVGFVANVEIYTVWVIMYVKLDTI